MRVADGGGFPGHRACDGESRSEVAVHDFRHGWGGEWEGVVVGRGFGRAGCTDMGRWLRCQMVIGREWRDWGGG